MIKLSSLGDIVHALPVLHALKRRWPEARVDWLVDESYARLLAGHPELDEVIALPRRRSSAPGRLAGLVRELRAREYDTVVDLQGLFRSGLLAALAGGRLRAGFANGREFSPLFYNLRVQVPAVDMHAVDRYLLVAQALGAAGDREPEFTLPEPEAARSYAAGVLRKNGALNVLVSPMTRWPTKCWPADRYAALADGLIGELQARVELDGLAQHGGALQQDLEVVALFLEDGLMQRPNAKYRHTVELQSRPDGLLSGVVNY